MPGTFGDTTFGESTFGGDEDPDAMPPESSMITRGLGANPRLLTRGLSSAAPPPLSPSLVTRGMGSPARLLTRGLRPLLPAPSGSGRRRGSRAFGASGLLGGSTFGPGQIG